MDKFKLLINKAEKFLKYVAVFVIILEGLESILEKIKAKDTEKSDADKQ